MLNGTAKKKKSLLIFLYFASFTHGSNLILFLVNSFLLMKKDRWYFYFFSQFLRLSQSFKYFIPIKANTNELKALQNVKQFVDLKTNFQDICLHCLSIRTSTAIWHISSSTCPSGQPVWMGFSFCIFPIKVSHILHSRDNSGLFGSRVQD